MSQILKDFQNFNIGDSTATLWVFKKSMKAKVPHFSGRWIEMKDSLDEAMKAAAISARAAITETLDYGLLQENNESSALTLTIEETYAQLVVDQTVNETGARQVKKLKDINNTSFYAVKLIADGKTLYGVKRADDSWKAKKSASLMSVIYKNDVLELDEEPSFNISKYFDFFIYDGNILITNKKVFESLLSYREAHIEAFIELQAEPGFSSIFTGIDHIAAFVGDNKIQLRRAAAIQQKGHYKDVNFMSNLTKHSKDMNLNIEFDAAGKIIATADNCRDIFQALLDHRLDSRLSKKLYDVQNTSEA